MSIYTINNRNKVKTPLKKKGEITLAKKTETTPKAVSEKKDSTSIRLFTFRVALRHKATIWRDIAITEKSSFEDFHDCIFEAFERYDDHMWSFFLPPSNTATLTIPRYGYPKAGREISICPEESGMGGASVFDGHKARLGKFITLPAMKFAYLFDYGDEWWHTITLRKTEEISSTESRKYPKIVETHGKAPSQYPEDEDEDGDDDGDL